ncbi:hypothetical protein LTR10_000356 [Elasticomyces elasticus]|nr:hypothetical protein LTR10_000356 [Elasticomyces elasticus]KAK4980390.1 hypothetical protein LTR42_000697 [Elasticomyces elasticus]
MAKKKAKAARRAVNAENATLNGLVVQVCALSTEVPDPVRGQMALLITEIAAAAQEITARAQSQAETMASQEEKIMRLRKTGKDQREENARSKKGSTGSSDVLDAPSNRRYELREPAASNNANLAPLGGRGVGVSPPGAPTPSLVAPWEMARTAPPEPAEPPMAIRHPAEALRDHRMHPDRQVGGAVTAFAKAMTTASAPSAPRALRAESAVPYASTHGTKRGLYDGEQNGPPKMPRLDADRLRAQQTAVPYINRIINTESAKLAGAGLSTESPQWREYVRYLQQHTGLGLAQLEPSTNVSLPGSAPHERSTSEPRLRAPSSPVARSEDPRLFNRPSALPVKVEMQTETPTARSEDPRLIQKTSALPSKAEAVTEMEMEIARSEGSPKIKVELEEGEILESEI